MKLLKCTLYYCTKTTTIPPTHSSSYDKVTMKKECKKCTVQGPDLVKVVEGTAILVELLLADALCVTR